MAPSLPRIGRKTRILLVLAAGLAVLVAAWDWNWFRHPVENYFIKRSQREVRVDDLHISFNSALEPTVRLRGVYVQNAPWADDRPFVTAKEIAFTFSLRSLRERRPIVSKLLLVDADVDLERQADGHRNWRLRNPENLARGRMKVVRLEARNSRIRFIRRDTDFEIIAASSPLPAPSSNVGGTLTQVVRFEGQFKDARYSGAAETSDLLTIMESGELFPIRGHMQAGKARLEVDGRLADLFRPSKVTGRMHVTGASLSDLYPFTRNRLPQSRPFDIAALFDQEGDAMTVRELRAKVGSTLLTGVASLDRTLEPPLLKVALRSEAAALVDLRSLGGARSRPPKPKAPKGQGDAASPRPGRMFADKALHFGRMQELDGEFSLHLKKLTAPEYPWLESLQLVAELKGGVLDLKPAIGIAEGKLRGVVRLDASTQPAAMTLQLDGEDMRIEKLLAGKPLAGTTAGPFEAHLDLRSRGDSMAALAAHASGSAKFGLANGVISRLADAALELDLGKAARAVLTGNEALAVNRIDLALDFKKGKGHVRNLFIDTERTRVVGIGTVDLDTESADLLLTPHPKKPGLFALDKSIRLHGPIRKPAFELVEREP